MANVAFPSRDLTKIKLKDMTHSKLAVLVSVLVLFISSCLDETTVQEESFLEAELLRLDANDISEIQTKTNPAGFIVGGVKAKKGEYPWQVVLIMSNRRGSFSCGGSILNENNILTAAHCAYDDKGKPFTPRQIAVRYKGVKISKMKTKRVEQIKVDMRYNPSRYPHDIAILQLKSPIKLEEGSVESISIPAAGSAELPDGTKLKVSGFGKTSSRGRPVNHLRHVEIEYIEHDRCQIESDYGDIIQDGMLCAGFMEGKKDTCQGDSGGPLVSYEEKLQVGIVSWGWGCGERNRPGVYVDTSKYAGWIEANMK